MALYYLAPLLLSIADLGFATLRRRNDNGNRKRKQAEASRIFNHPGNDGRDVSAWFSWPALLSIDHLKIGMAQFDKQSLTTAFILVCYSSLLILSKLFLSCLRPGVITQNPL